ncbi:GNAT family N-acetyltransferase [uncultured Dysgonomonas sp.]|uniref:N-acetyltransferase domain-containing protein n=1 Tax=uncultured Dysgonomonas sp. TaxID=206096 RepID=A0A212JTK3_9BACT|nr:GNAT family N-acetyltransferase [uncultured Dysgonomonas sp.]SBW02780.1 conserved hypothetical protein [uncultured Dysgonomonas sp.]
MFHIRIATLEDIPELKTLYKNVIMSVNTKDYTSEEATDWASCGNNEQRWTELITELYFIIVENESNTITGFSSISDSGYLHSMFVHKDFQNMGIATLLYQEITKYALTHNIRKITSEVSITARPFFEKQGFIVDEEQKRKANKLFLSNYRMSKLL